MHQVGEAISFVSEHEKYLLHKIESFIDSEIEAARWPENLNEGDYLPGEQKKIAIELDNQKKERNPNYQGAFHKRSRKKKRKP
jgi:ATP-dependent RNA helicase RhlE